MREQVRPRVGNAVGIGRVRKVLQKGGIDVDSEIRSAVLLIGPGQASEGWAIGSPSQQHDVLVNRAREVPCPEVTLRQPRSSGSLEA